jgi:hypothetical protein
MVALVRLCLSGKLSISVSPRESAVELILTPLAEMNHQPDEIKLGLQFWTGLVLLALIFTVALWWFISFDLPFDIRALLRGVQDSGD